MKRGISNSKQSGAIGFVGPTWGGPSLYGMAKPLPAERPDKRAGLFKITGRAFSRLCLKISRSDGSDGAGISRSKGCFAMIQDFKNMFRKKSEDSMQDRAERSRITTEFESELKRIDDLMEQTHHDIQELLKKEKANG